MSATRLLPLFVKLTPVVNVREQLDALVEQYDELRTETTTDDLSGGATDETRRRVERLCTRVMAASERLLPAGSAYAIQAEEAIHRHPRSGIVMNPGGVILRQFEVLRAFSEDWEAGFHQELQASIRAGVFADFLEMAEHVLEDIHKTPAAIIAGFTLEEHLRKLCEARGIATTSARGNPKKANALNADLAKAGEYSSKTEQKDVTAWLGRRNEAAHGNHDEYSDEEAGLMIEGVRGFVTRHPV